MKTQRDVTTMIDDPNKLLTMIARTSVRDHRSVEFASILTASLAATAANVGGPDVVLGGRPESWEASYIRDLLRSAMSDCPQHWWPLMTEPVVVCCLNVAQLIEDPDLHPRLIGLDEAEDNLHAASDHYSDQDRLSPDHEAALHDLWKPYADGYALCVERFTAACRSCARRSSTMIATVSATASS